MPAKNFHDLDDLSTFIAIVIGLWGSILSFIKRDRKDLTIFRKIAMFLLDMITNVGITLLTYFGLIGYGVDELLAVAISGFIGHQGTRGFYLIELAIADKIGSKEMLNEIKKGEK